MMVLKNRRRHRLARTAGVLWADVAVHEEPCLFHVQLRADVLANFDRAGAALAARPQPLLRRSAPANMPKPSKNIDAMPGSGTGLVVSRAMKDRLSA